MSRTPEAARLAASPSGSNDFKNSPVQARNCLPTSRKAGFSKPIRGDPNPIRLRQAGATTIPLKTENLELLSGKERSTDHVSKHGGSAALLHASRSQPQRRETLRYSYQDAQGNIKTEAFRPRRSIDDSSRIVEVMEESDVPNMLPSNRGLGTELRRTQRTSNTSGGILELEESRNMGSSHGSDRRMPSSRWGDGEVCKARRRYR